MCYPVQCPNCGKTGWGGCGRHVDTVMKSVPISDRCACLDDSVRTPGTGVVRKLLRRWPRLDRRAAAGE